MASLQIVPAAESFFAALEFELLMKHDWEMRAEARRALHRRLMPKRNNDARGQEHPKYPDWGPFWGPFPAANPVISG